MQPVENFYPQQSAQQAAPVRRRSFPWGLVVLLIIIALIVGGISFAKSKHGGMVKPDAKLYQAVFLTNGQVYFGKLSDVTRHNLVLEDIYYLQVVQPLQQQGDGTTPQQPAQQGQDESGLNLVKMGSEIHGPTDKMIIPMNNVVFWEDIKSDGTVAKAIEEYKNQPKK